jgi:hypothetical protein
MRHTYGGAARQILLLLALTAAAVLLLCVCAQPLQAVAPITVGSDLCRALSAQHLGAAGCLLSEIQTLV